MKSLQLNCKSNRGLQRLCAPVTRLSFSHTSGLLFVFAMIPSSRLSSGIFLFSGRSFVLV